jgi:gluconokinase
MVATGKAEPFEDIKRNIPMGMPVVANKENSVLYKTLYKRYDGLAEDIAKYF